MLELSIEGVLLHYLAILVFISSLFANERPALQKALDRHFAPQKVSDFHVIKKIDDTYFLRVKTNKTCVKVYFTKSERTVAAKTAKKTEATFQPRYEYPVVKCAK